MNTSPAEKVLGPGSGWLLTVLIGALLSAAHPAAAQPIGTETPLRNVGAFSRPPTLDGQLGDGEWGQADGGTAFRHFQSGEPSARATHAWVGIDAEFVYVAFECAEAEMDKLKPATLAPDSMTIFARDHVEVFLMPDALAPAFYHFSFDVSGNRYDARGSDATWNGEWQGAVHLGKTGWTVEMRISRASIGMDNPRMALANFCRTRRLVPGETSAWSPTFGPFHNPARFGRLVFGPPSKARLSSLSLNQPVIGQNRIHVTAKDAPADAIIKGYLLQDGKARQFGAGVPPTSVFPLQRERDSEVDLLVTVEANGKVLDFRPAMSVGLSGTQPKPVRRVLGPEVAPAMRWIDSERLRGISYMVVSGPKMPEDGLAKADATIEPAAMHLRGQSHFRIRAKAGEPIHFALAAEKGESVFTQAVYAVFGPQGKIIGQGVVAAGTSQEVRIPAQTDGTHVLLVNSGPAMWNPFTITLRNEHWVLDARGKSQYVGTPVALHSLRDCKLAGCNLALMAAWAWGMPFKTDGELATWRARLEELCAASQAAGIRIIPYLGWGCGRYDCDSVPAYTRALTRLSVRGPQPCPASREYWEGSFLRRAMVMAELSKTYPVIVGAGLDPESYYFSSWYKNHLKSEEERGKIWSIVMPIGGSPEKCICDECLQSFLKAKGIADPHLAEDGNVRFDWLAKQGLRDELFVHQQARLEGVLTSVRKRLQAVNPDFCLAVMHLSTGDDWFRRGMARGLGTRHMPILDFDEGTYTTGYSERAITTKLGRYQRWDAPVVHGGTLWTLKHPPANPHSFAAQMFNFALYGHSYWVWPGSMSLWRSADRVRNYFSLSGYPEDYWAAIALANQEIDRRLAAPTTYRSRLERIDKRAKIPDQPKVQNEWAKKPCYPVHLYSGTRLSFRVPAGKKQIRVLWGYRRALGKQTLAVSVAGKTHETVVDVVAEQANVIELDVPADGAPGWVELRRSGPPVCVGIKIDGAKPFFGAGNGMSLR